MNNKALSRAMTLFLLLGGTFCLLTLNRTNYPIVRWDILRIKTIFPNASAKNVEVKATNKIEKKLLEISGIEKIVSHSMDNLSLVMVTLDSKHKNPDKIKKEIRNKLDSLRNFPSRPIIEDIKTSDAAIIELAIKGKNQELRNDIAKRLKDKLLSLKGIIGINTPNILEKEIFIEVDLEKLKEKKLSFQNIVYALQSHHLPSSGFQIKTLSGLKKILTHSRFENIEDLKELIIRSNSSGKRIRLHEVAKIKEDFESPTVLVRTDGEDSHNLTLKVSAETDNITLSKKIRQTLDIFKESLPPEIQIEVIKDLSLYTKELLSILGTNTIIGFLFVLIILYFFLPPYVAFWTAMGIPLSFLGSFILFKIFSIPINTVTLVSLVLVLGLLVDDAIVIAEHIASKKEKGLTSFEAVLKGVQEIFWPVTVTILTTLLAFAPLYFLDGLNGQFIRHIPVVVSMALIISLFEATILLPIHLMHEKGKTPKNRPYKKLLSLYRTTLTYSLKFRALTLIIFASLLMGTIQFFVTKGKFVLFPLDDVDFFHVVAELSPGTPLLKTKEKMKEVEKIISQISSKEMLHFTTKIGHHQTNPFDPFFATQENWAMISVILKPSAQRNITSEALVASLKKNFSSLHGFERIDIEFNNDGPPIGKPFELSLLSHDDQLRSSLSQKILKELKNWKGVYNATTSEREGKKQLSLFPDPKKLAAMSVKAITLEETIALAFKEQEIGRFLKEGEDRPIKIKLGGNKNNEKSLLKNIPIPNSRGALIPLKKLAVISEGPSRGSFQHTRGIRSVTIKADIDQSKITSLELNKKIKELLKNEVLKYKSVDFLWGGENKSTKETLKDLFITFGIVLFLIYFSILWTLKSMVLPLIILGILPFGAIGIIWAFTLHGLPLSFLGIVGGIGLLGIMVNDGLILLCLFTSLKSKNNQDLLEASISRFRPVLLTTLTTVAGMIPTIYGIGGSETFIIPIVLAVAGGIIFATFVTLYMIPCLFSLYVDRFKLTDPFSKIPLKKDIEMAPIS
jgi:multidrug efflux pump subunit AcrB